MIKKILFENEFSKTRTQLCVLTDRNLKKDKSPLNIFLKKSKTSLINNTIVTNNYTN